MSLLLIAAATLTPFGSRVEGQPDAAFWCFSCTSLAGADFTTNVLLFLPLGVALAFFNGASPLRVFVAGIVLSCFIETAQSFGISPGRVASVSDIVSNALGAVTGGWVGFHWRTWSRPGVATASRLAAVSGLLVTALLSFTSWALGRDTYSASAAQTSELPFTPGFGWFHGRIQNATYNGRKFQHSGDGPMIVQAHPTDSISTSVTLAGADERQSFVPMLYVQGQAGDSSAILLLGQHGTDAELRLRIRGSRLKLAAPELLLRDVFASPRDTLKEFSVDVQSQRWTLVERQADRTRSSELLLSLPLGWTLFQSVLHASQPAGVVFSALWLAALFLPIGYWCAFALRNTAKRSDISAVNGTHASRSATNARLHITAIAGVSVATIGLILAPRIGSLSPTGVRDAATAAAGFAGGWLLGALVRHRWGQGENMQFERQSHDELE